MKTDPSKTLTLRNAFQRKLRARFSILTQDIVEILVTKDAFGLSKKPKVKLVTAAAVDVGEGAWSFLSDDRKLAEFENWLQQETGLIIEPEGDIWQSYVEEGYRRGAGRAYDQVNKARIAATTSQSGLSFIGGQRAQFVASLGGPEAVEKVRLLASRVFTDLKGVNEVMATQLRKELVDGLVQGDNPRVIARRIRDRTGKSLKHAQRIARTEIIRAHAEGQLDALERLGVEEVGVDVEWSTAGDDRVCPICLPLDGAIFKIKEAHGMIPAHPNCRCAFVPAIPDLSKPKPEPKKQTLEEKLDSNEELNDIHKKMLANEEIQKELDQLEAKWTSLAQERVKQANLQGELLNKVPSNTSSPEFKKIQDKLSSVTEEMIQARRDWVNARIKARIAFEDAIKLEIKDRAKINVRVPPSVASQEFKEGVAEGKSYLERLVKKSNKTKNINFDAVDLPPNMRAYYSPAGNEIRLSPEAANKTYVHEMGHALENNVPGLKKLSAEFRETRIALAKTKDVPMNKFGDFYDPSEVGNPDDWTKLFKFESHAAYVGKRYAAGDTEVLSMGLEKLYSDPVGMAKLDPQYFKFVIGALRGIL